MNFIFLLFLEVCMQWVLCKVNVTPFWRQLLCTRPIAFIDEQQKHEIYLLNEFYFCGFYQCVNSGESLTNWVKLVIRQSLHINKIHENNSNFVIKILFLLTLLYMLGVGGRKTVPRFRLMEFIEV